MLNIKGTNDNLYVNFVIMRELTNRMLKQKVINQNVIYSWSVLIDYLKATMKRIKVLLSPTVIYDDDDDKKMFL